MLTIQDLTQLTNYQFEVLIGKLLKSMGYQIKHIPVGEDLGIDLIATNNQESLAVQVKKYETRRLNLDIVYHTYAAASYYDCSKPILVTLGDLTPNAKKASEKLGVQIWNQIFVLNLLKKNKISDSYENKEKEWFDYIWNHHFKSLKGEKVNHLKKKTSITIEDVDDSGVYEISSNNNKRFFPITVFEFALLRLRKDGSITRTTINDEYKRRGSSAIVAILATIPGVSLDNESKSITLLYDENQ